MKQGTRLSVVVLVLGCVAGAPAARASEPPPTPARAEPERVRGVWLSFKLAMPLSGTGGFGAAPMPRFLVGYHLGRVALGVEVGIGGGRSWVREGSDAMVADWRDLEVSLIPTVEVVVARRGRLALTVQTGLGVGLVWSGYPDDQYRWSSLVGVAQAAFGARYHLHPRFALGAEVGVTAQYAWTSTTFQDSHSEVHSVRVNPWAALTATVIW